MKRLSEREVEAAKHSTHLIMGDKVQSNFAFVTDKKTGEKVKATHTFEVVGHNRVTIDISSNFVQAAASLKASRDQGNKDVRLYRINNITGRKTREWVNPKY